MHHRNIVTECKLLSILLLGCNLAKNDVNELTINKSIKKQSTILY